MKSVQYNQGDEVIEVTVRDHTGARIEVRRCNLSDEKECGKLVKWLKEKYGFKFKIDREWLELDNEFLKF